MNNSHDLSALIQGNIKQILSTYDKDKNSSLDKEELRKVLADGLGVSSESITQEQLDWHFDKIDENHDGKITFQQYFNHFFLKRAKDAKKKKQGDNEDQLIDLNEFRRLMEDTFKPLNIKITQEMVQWNFNQIDKDSSGRISFEEFIAFIRKYNS